MLEHVVNLEWNQELDATREKAMQKVTLQVQEVVNFKKDILYLRISFYLYITLINDKIIVWRK